MKTNPYPFQWEAIEKIIAELSESPRAKAIMPCGTGKTLVGMHVKEKLSPRRTLITAPTLALVKQLLDSYADEGVISRVLVVCSDNTTAKDARENYDIPNVTTDPKAVAEELRKDGELTVFGTYQSTPRIAEAFAFGHVPGFDFAVFDEAHRMAGASKHFATALFDEEIPVRKRLFMTATPRVASESASKRADDEGIPVTSMDDEKRFGREAFYMSFRDAVEGGYLTDYRVAIFFVKESEVRSLVDKDKDAKEVAKRVALVRAMGQHDIRKVLAYHRTVKKMRQFAGFGILKTFDAARESCIVDGQLWSASLAGTDDAKTRNAKLREFASLNGNYRAVLSNCRVLQEGVDCPSVDAVCLIDPRSQPVDIVQIIGRAMRNSPNKKIATIILPVFMPAGLEKDADIFVSSGDFSQVWDVLAALRSHDDRVQGWVESKKAVKESVRKGHIGIHVDASESFHAKFLECISSRIVRRFHDPMPLTEDLVKEWMQAFHQKHGTWPQGTRESCPDGSTWRAVDIALRQGHRGLPGGSSLRELRLQITGWQNRSSLTVNLIKKWMQDFHRKHGEWPNIKIQERCPDGSTWRAVDCAIRQGRRGFSGGLSLTKLRMQITGEKRGERLPLTIDLIKKWMQEFYEKHGEWPNVKTQELCPDGSTWIAVYAALFQGHRGLPGGSSFLKLRKQIEEEVLSQ